MKKFNLMFKDKNSRKILTKVVSYSSIYIFGPMIFLGTVGYIIDKTLKNGPKFLFIGIGLAFVCSNFLLLKKRHLLSERLKGDVGEIIGS